MSIECHVCGHKNNPNGAEFCEVCGAELAALTSANSPTSFDDEPFDSTFNVTPPLDLDNFPSPPSSLPSPSATMASTARLIAKLPNTPVAEFPIVGTAIVGVFTPESGPVDIDLENFPGGDTISKQHAEIIYQNGSWIIKDQSTNGTYIKPLGQTRFGARINGPTPLNSGDEIAFAKVSFVFQSP